jgi:hypothetical protein
MHCWFRKLSQALVAALPAQLRWSCRAVLKFARAEQANKLHMLTQHAQTCKWQHAQQPKLLHALLLLLTKAHAVCQHST